MNKITEILIGNLAINAPDDRMAFLIEQINNNIKPPRAVTADSVNIRAMYVVNNLINWHGGRFRRDDIAQLATLIMDTPVLVGHNRSDAPLARTFHAELEEHGGTLWLKSYFYWPKTDGQDELLQKIDSGVLKECSISFVYSVPECSVCGEDMRKCPHDTDRQSNDQSRPHFLYGGISQVLETSLVYKGAVKGTYITDKLSLPADRHPIIRADGRIYKMPIPAFSSDRMIMIDAFGRCAVEPPCILHRPEGISIATALRNGISYLLYKRS